jgi:hypothetical protein
MGKFLGAVVIAIGFVGLVFSLGLLFAWPVMLLVNYLFNPVFLATVFHTGHFTIWDAWLLNILAGFLFKNSTSK